MQMLTPQIRSIYWCFLPKDTNPPEFGGEKVRPVVVISYDTRTGASTVLPCSTSPQDDNEWAHKLGSNLNMKDTWVVCDKPMTLSHKRFTKNYRRIIPNDEFKKILEIVYRWLPDPEKI